MDNPLLEAMSQRKTVDMNDPQALLEFILSKFDLVPKENEADQNDSEAEPMNVQTQESHAP
jgi:hypothetical protein